MTETIEIKAGVELPAQREDIELHTTDGLTLVGELALPLDREPVATMLALHPLPTAGGFMDSHIIRKAAARLPALSDIAVLRFNFRGTTSPRGTSGGEFGDGVDEAWDLQAAVEFLHRRGLPAPWLVGWSFGTEVALKHGRRYDIPGVVLLSPPLRRTSDAELAAWAGSGKRMIAVVPEFDDFLRPDEAVQRFAAVPEAEVIAVEDGKHLWVGEKQTRRVLNEIVERLNPARAPLPTTYPS
ncbi:alpha/beta fold hydrolase [Salinibacterium sp. dk2585]|uniref:alpha/beta hydrolase n=1 Tax=unclassified Salinibacterium TaxID=2632331 RepID=UPI0011C25475|nr:MULTISPECIES: alpha/beta fold hydrolase [unclassified Salinibacterium]QEE61582.1 alpha/beta fold hydrolase [Salinibacterium sp. dk2585]TXK52449.1 alpha/beta fold hydrolase [Salinibacterium sp. dk5596]